ncbi:DDE domain protein (plasmid) [Bacillus cereus]|nr:DDE domain protein [Bacillus cereus]AJI07959.1 DDE domain protein [Bacillus cereus G9241]
MCESQWSMDVPITFRQIRLIFILVKQENIRLQSAFLKKFAVRVITVDKNSAYSMAIEELKKERKIPLGIQIRQAKYLNNIVEQGYWFIKRRVGSMLGLKSFKTAISIVSGVEAMHMMKKSNLLYWTSLSKNRKNLFTNSLA